MPEAVLPSTSMPLSWVRVKSAPRPRSAIWRPSPVSRVIAMPGMRCSDSARFRSGKAAISGGENIVLGADGTTLQRPARLQGSGDSRRRRSRRFLGTRRPRARPGHAPARSASATPAWARRRGAATGSARCRASAPRTPPRIDAERLVPRSSWSSASRTVRAPRTPAGAAAGDTTLGATTTCTPVACENCEMALRRSDAAMSKRIWRARTRHRPRAPGAMAGTASATASAINESPSSAVHDIPPLGRDVRLGEEDGAFGQDPDKRILLQRSVTELSVA